MDENRPQGSATSIGGKVKDFSPWKSTIQDPCI